MRLYISIEVDYDESTVISEQLLFNALHEELHKFVDSGGLSPTGREVVSSLEYGVSSVEDPAAEDGVINRVLEILKANRLRSRDAVEAVQKFCEGYKK